jgi:4-hydroxy-tetrahydrodipicolinate synthase
VITPFRNGEVDYETYAKAVSHDTNPIPIKYMMKRLGIMPANEHRLPMMPASPEIEQRLDGVLTRAGLTAGGLAA